MEISLLSTAWAKYLACLMYCSNSIALLGCFVRVAWWMCDYFEVMVWSKCDRWANIEWSLCSRGGALRAVIGGLWGFFEKSVESLMEPCFTGCLMRSLKRRVCKSARVSIMLTNGAVRNEMATSEATRCDQSGNSSEYEKTGMCHSNWTSDLRRRWSVEVVCVYQYTHS